MKTNLLVLVIVGIEFIKTNLEEEAGDARNPVFLRYEILFKKFVKIV